jgi:disulfide bond formation protein DsbB
MRRDILYTILAAAVLALTVIPVGAAVFVLGFINGDSPCVMCWEERTAMVLIALLGLFVLRYGPRPKYLGLSILVGAWGIHMALRHTAMHAARDVGQGFSIEILGAHTYTWALFIFLACIVTIGLLLVATREDDFEGAPRKLRPLDKLALWIFLLVTAGNIVQAFASTGPPPFMGQGDPVRFTFNPRHWVWSLEEYSSAPVSLRGRWAIEKPDLASVSADPGAGPLADLPALGIREQKRIALPLRGTITDLAYDAAADRFLVTTQHGVYIADGSLARILRHTVVDPGYSVDLGRFAGAAFLGGGEVMALGENKSYVILRPDDRADAAANYRYFLESFDRFVELSRSRLATVRARMMYVMSLAYDPAGNSLYTISVPNSKIRRLVVSRFDRHDLTLSEEFVLRPASDSGLKFAGEKRSLDELFVTGATVADGRMYAISAAYNTLLTIDLGARAAVAAHAVAGLVRPTGIAVRGGDLYIIGEDGLLSIVPLPLFR